jgi:hypothetical protein
MDSMMEWVNPAWGSARFPFLGKAFNKERQFQIFQQERKQ